MGDVVACLVRSLVKTRELQRTPVPTRHLFCALGCGGARGKDVGWKARHKPSIKVTLESVSDINRMY